MKPSQSMVKDRSILLVPSRTITLLSLRLEASKAKRNSTPEMYHL